MTGLVIPETVMGVFVTTSSFWGLSRVILSSEELFWGAGVLSGFESLELKEELIRQTPKAIISPKLIPITVAQITSLRIECQYRTGIESCQERWALLVCG